MTAPLCRAALGLTAAGAAAAPEPESAVLAAGGAPHGARNAAEPGLEGDPGAPVR